MEVQAALSNTHRHCVGDRIVVEMSATIVGRDEQITRGGGYLVQPDDPTAAQVSVAAGYVFPEDEEPTVLTTTAAEHGTRASRCNASSCSKSSM